MEPECQGCGGGLRQASRTVRVCFGIVLLALALVAIFSDSDTRAPARPPSNVAPQSVGAR